MASLKELRNRIGSVRSTRQITSAMKMVAAAKLKGAQDRVTGFRPYSENMSRIISSLINPEDEKLASPFMNPNEGKNILIMLFTSNRGLCGGFNNNIVKSAIEYAETNFAAEIKNQQLSFYCIGKKGADLIRRRGFKIEELNQEILDNANFANANEISEAIMKAFTNNEYSKVILAYNMFRNAVTQVQTIEQFLPVLPPVAEENSKDYIYEPNTDKLVIDIIPKTIKIQFHKALLDSVASEHGARMTAMHQATDNATEIIRELTLQYNKARQAAITNEILEITSGAEALKA
ncbi:MAG: ATP synthase F1 subunit gamma [Bacteroidales bacterium]|nr:ATP synthase F1 subunit gamma [Bacteroidales bacterium]